MFLSETGSPLKHNDLLSEVPPNALQKSDSACQSWLSVLGEEELMGAPALPCSEGAKGEFDIDTFWHSSHTVEQKLFSDFEEAVELQRMGIG